MDALRPSSACARKQDAVLLQFPETEFLVCPAQTEGITASNWFLEPEKCRVVLGELERCGKQFGCMLPEGAPIGFRA